MKTLKYLFLLITLVSFAGACLVDDEEIYEQNATGYNVATFEKFATNLGALANGAEYQRVLNMKLVGPTVKDLTGDVTVTVEADASSTAESGVHYRIDNPTITLNASDNYLGTLTVTMVTEGNSPPEDGTPELEAYVAPVLVLNVKSVTGDSRVTNSGKQNTVTLNFTRPNPYAGAYIAHMIYRHPSYGTYPNNIYRDADYEKELVAVTGRKAETTFGVWEDKCWITVNLDNSITYVVENRSDVKMGDPNRPDLISHFDPVTRKIYLYYHYEGTGGPRIFWEVFTPQF